MSPKEDKTHDRKSNPGSGSGGDGQGDRGKDIVPPPPPESPKDRAPGKSVGDDDDDDVVVIVPPPAPTPVPSAGDTGGKQAPRVGGRVEGTSTARGKKRGRPPKAKEPVVADQGAVLVGEGERPMKRALEFDAPEVPRPCSVCGKNFNNYKALFGHMRSHPGRLWRGAYPPPISPPSSPPREIQHEGEQLASSLLSIGERLLLGDPEEGGDDGAGASGSQPSASAHPRGLDIDLNLDPVLSDPPSPENVEGEKKEIDLNKNPSDEGEGEGDKW